MSASPSSSSSPVVVVTGAGSGVGRAVARKFAAEGWQLALVGRHEGTLRETATESGGDETGRCAVFTCDVGQADDVARMATAVLSRFGHVDVLVNSAGVIQSGGVESLPLGEWRKVIDINLLGTLYTCKAAIGPMKAQGAGDIINISSTAGRRAAGLFGPYSTSKFGLTGLTEGLRQEVGGAGIRVSIVEPGATETEVAGGIIDPAMRAAMAEHVSKDGAMQPSDIADAIVFIASLPARANVSQILIRPTIDTAAM